MRANSLIGTLSLILTIMILLVLLQFASFQSSPDKINYVESGESLWINNIVEIIVALGTIGLLALTVMVHRKFTRFEGIHEVDETILEPPSMNKEIDSPDIGPLIERFSPVQIVIHALTGISIMSLYVTGIPLLYPEHLGWVTEMIGLSRNMFIHRFAGIGLASAAIYYLIYSVLYIKYVDRHFVRNLIPSIRDVRGAQSDVKSVFGMRAAKVDSGKFNWLEKVDIFSVAVFDGLIMCGTGIVLWAPWLFISFIPKSLIVTINVLHGGFAVLSLCGILLHFYVVHLTPHRFPMDFSIFRGTIPAQEAEEEYPLWVKEISGDNP